MASNLSLAPSGNPLLDMTPLEQLQQAMSVLAFADPAHCGVPAVEALFEPHRWVELEGLFIRTAMVALGFGPHSRLRRLLYLGLTALKQPCVLLRC